MIAFADVTSFCYCLSCTHLLCDYLSLPIRIDEGGILYGVEVVEFGVIVLLFEQCDGNHYFWNRLLSVVFILFLFIYFFIYFILFIFIYKNLTF